MDDLRPMLEEDKVERTCTVSETVLTCTMEIMPKCKTPTSISAADMYYYCSQRLYKSSFPYINPCARNFLYQNTAIVDKLNSKQLETSTFYPDSFPVARNFVIDRWNSELAYYQIDAFDSWRLHESEIQVQSNQRFFFLAASRLVFAASRLSRSSD